MKRKKYGSLCYRGGMADKSSILFNPAFRVLPRIDKLELLQDWISILEKNYNDLLLANQTETKDVPLNVIKFPKPEMGVLTPEDVNRIEDHFKE